MKQAVVDKDSYVATSALVSAYRLTFLNTQNHEIVLFLFKIYSSKVTKINLKFLKIKRWSQEVGEAAKNQDSTLVSYHALGLLYRIRKHDRFLFFSLLLSLSILLSYLNAQIGCFSSCCIKSKSTIQRIFITL